MNVDFLTKEFVESYSYNDYSSDREFIKEIEVNGRQYDKHCVDTTSGVVGNVYKISDENYLLLVGTSRQSPDYVNPNPSDLVTDLYETASVNSFSSPSIMVVLDHYPRYVEFRDLAEWYISNHKRVEVKTAEEILSKLTSDQYHHGTSNTCCE